MSVAAPRKLSAPRPGEPSGKQPRLMDGKVEALARLTLKLQSSLQLKPHEAVTRAKGLLDVVPPSPQRNMKLSIDAVIAKERALLATKRRGSGQAPAKASPDAGPGAQPSSHGVSSSSASVVSASELYQHTNAYSSVPGAALEHLPPTTRRHRTKQDIWTQLVNIQTKEAEADSAAAVEAAERHKLELRIALEAQLAEREAVKRREENERQKFGASILADAAAHAREVLEAEKTRHAATVSLANELKAYNIQQQRLKRVNELQEVAADKAEIKALQKSLRAEAKAADTRKDKELDAVRAFIRQNDAYIAEKQASLKRTKEEARLAAIEAEAELERREALRAADIERRLADQRRRLDRMSGVFEKKAAVDRAADERVDRERERRESQQDAADAARIAARAAALEDMRITLAAQVAEHEVARAVAQEEARRVLAAADAAAAEEAASQAHARSARTRAAVAMRGELERQIKETVAAQMCPDETPLEKAMNERLLAGGGGGMGQRRRTAPGSARRGARARASMSSEGGDGEE